MLRHSQATQFLVKLLQNVTGVDASLLSLKRAQQNVRQAEYVEGFVEHLVYQIPELSRLNLY